MNGAVEPTYANFKQHPKIEWFVRIATGEKVQAFKSTFMWNFEDFQIGDFVVCDGPRIYRCPPKRFWLIFKIADGVQ